MKTGLLRRCDGDHAAGAVWRRSPRRPFSETQGPSMSISLPTAGASARATRSRLPVYVLCWLCLVADGYDLMTYGATIPALIGKAPFHLTPAQAGHIGSIALTGMLAGSLVAGMLTDRIGRRRIFIASVAVFSLGMLLTSVAPTLDLFVAFRILTCFGVGGLLPTAVALASEFSNPTSRSRTLGRVLTGPPVGMVVASFLASRLVPDHGFRPIYALAGVMLLLVPLLWALLPESPSFLAARGRHDAGARARPAEHPG